MRKSTIAVVLAGAVVGFAHNPAPADAAPIPSTYRVTAPCVLEDGSSQNACVWDASRLGNRQGQSSVSMNYGNRFVMLKRHPVKAVSKANPLVVKITRGRATVVQGRTILAKNAQVQSI